MQKMAQNQRGIGENQGSKARRFCRFSKSYSENLKARIYQEKLRQITMRANPNKIQKPPINLIYQQQIWLDMALSKVLITAPKLVVFVFWLKPHTTLKPCDYFLDNRSGVPLPKNPVKIFLKRFLYLDFKRQARLFSASHKHQNPKHLLSS